MSLKFDLRPSAAPRSDAEREAILADPGFGTHFTDHMAVATWTAQDGWGDSAVVPYGPFQVDPATAVLHYAQEIFEGMKAYRHADGSVWLFRPFKNAERFNASARRMALPELAEESFVESIEALVEADESWVPAGGETSLYLRPFMFASEAFLGVRSAQRVQYCVIASPAGSYFSGGVRPVSIWLSREYTRAAPGGTGAAKCGGNYAASLVAQAEAARHGCSQVLFTDAVERRWVDELGGMNVYFVTDRDELVTPELGTILEGVTRDAIIALAPELGLTPVERRVSLQEILDGLRSGAVREIFACGTAAVITPIGELKDVEGTYQVGDGQAGQITSRLRQALLDLQYGRTPDTHGWMHRIR
ncbi:branched-chain amino acid aminotransferase [Auraticoccus sp. F435]|uniref:Branched-chain-amino-acid aminotransferase n=1 Tax=Auraticoccus cholistanensis TaxID=2656650 RepID=A0A6A9UVD1_9ACTN|nr:branched-chain amino acid aminotransferase [Auraticoccus cholistanensis]MVA75635.1 branched-chain amino acid aminotransferase [Auraticoccus cholistanensis]